MEISLRKKKKSKHLHRYVSVKYSAQILSILFIRDRVELMIQSATSKQQPSLQGHQPPAPEGTLKLNPASIIVARHHAHYQ